MNWQTTEAQRVVTLNPTSARLSLKNQIVKAEHFIGSLRSDRPANLGIRAVSFVGLTLSAAAVLTQPGLIIPLMGVGVCVSALGLFADERLKRPDRYENGR